MDPCGAVGVVWESAVAVFCCPAAATWCATGFLLCRFLPYSLLNGIDIGIIQLTFCRVFARGEVEVAMSGAFRVYICWQALF